MVNQVKCANNTKYYWIPLWNSPEEQARGWSSVTQVSAANIAKGFHSWLLYELSTALVEEDTEWISSLVFLCFSWACSASCSTLSSCLTCRMSNIYFQSGTHSVFCSSQFVYFCHSYQCDCIDASGFVFAL